MAKIELTHGLFAEIDDADIHLISGRSWTWLGTSQKRPKDL